MRRNRLRRSSERSVLGRNLRILILNWRCPRHPQAGGAEAVTLEVARRLVKRGVSVEWFSATYPGAPREELLDGIRIIRRGRQWSVHWQAYRHYRGILADDFDVLIDQVNTVPFFTPLWSKIPVVMFIHQLAREVWWYESPFPISLIGFALEPLYLRIYARKPVLTVSNSTRNDLLGLGFRGRIVIVPQGIELTAESNFEKATEPTFLYVGRLAPSKRIGDLIRAFATFDRGNGNGHLTLIGEGNAAYVRHLVRLAEREGVSGKVRFLGRVSQRTKHFEMARSHALLLASVREGWGLVVTEANAMGTPAVAYDVPGLRDSVLRDVTGLLVRPSPQDLAAGIERIWRDAPLRSRLSEAARTVGAAHTFDRTALAFIDALSVEAGPPDRTSVTAKSGLRV